MPAHQERTSRPREASLSLLPARARLPPTSPQAVTDRPAVTGQLICKYSSHQFRAQLANTYLLFGGWAFYSAFKIRNSQTARETDIRRGKAVWGHLLGVSPPLQPGPQDGPTSLCLVGSDPHLVSWLALGNWGPLAGAGTPPVSSGTPGWRWDPPGRLWDPRSALGPPAGSAPAPSPACLTHLLYGRPLLPCLQEPPSSASLLHPLGVSSSCQVRFCPLPSNLARQGLQQREGLFRKQPSTEAKPT